MTASASRLPADETRCFRTRQIVIFRASTESFDFPRPMIRQDAALTSKGGTEMAEERYVLDQLAAVGQLYERYLELSRVEELPLASEDPPEFFAPTPSLPTLTFRH